MGRLFPANILYSKMVSLMMIFLILKQMGKISNFTKDFTGTKRLSVKRGVDSFNLTISKTQLGDSAAYYCAAIEVDKVTFEEGAVLIVKDLESNSMSVVQHPLSESVQPGNSVTLNCTIHTETCSGEHRAYWFRHGSGETRPGIIYRISPLGTFASLMLGFATVLWPRGEILFGNGTKLDIQDHRADLLLLVYCLGVGLAFSLILIIVLACIMYKMNQRKSLQVSCSSLISPSTDVSAVEEGVASFASFFSGSVSLTACPAVSSKDAGAQDADNLHYVALNLSNKKNRSRREREVTWRQWCTLELDSRTG
ncbi:uncharacterized protein isoform X1 [Salmo salar]|uniref:Uncharacterized protein isoform X1 n=1 Tax=Salmo salar TaxID=8030 RepID=A0ABM3F5A6_SALSA|nr:uncharacterized protein LOC106608794 isoform X1 [Salmo salar]